MQQHSMHSNREKKILPVSASEVAGFLSLAFVVTFMIYVCVRILTLHHGALALDYAAKWSKQVLTLSVYVQQGLQYYHC